MLLCKDIKSFMYILGVTNIISKMCRSTFVFIEIDFAKNCANFGHSLSMYRLGFNFIYITIMFANDG